MNNINNNTIKTKIKIKINGLNNSDQEQTLRNLIYFSASSLKFKIVIDVKHLLCYVMIS